MSSKKKLIIAVCAFSLIILASVVSIVAVLAAQKVTINSTINVTYTSQEVAGKVTAQYQIANGKATNIGDGSITYSGSETGTPTTTLGGTSGVTITGLTSTNKYIDFIFTFTNTGSAQYTATVVLPTTVSNFTVSHETLPTTKTSNTSFTVAGGTTTAVTYKVRYTIDDVSKNASISGTFAWTLE